MIKKVFIIFAGVVVGVIIIYLIESLGHAVFPPSHDIDMNDAESRRQMTDKLPFGAFLFVLAAYAIGSFCGGLVSSLLSRKAEVGGAVGVGAVLMIFGIMNLFMIPHPIWFIVVSLLLYLPCAYLGGKAALVLKRRNNE